MRRLLQLALSSFLYPNEAVHLHQSDWYHRKGYADFKDFVSKQIENPKSRYYQDFQSIDLKRFTLAAQDVHGKSHAIDAVQLTPTLDENKTLPGTGLHMIQLWGARVPYEARFQDLSMAAKSTGATQYSLNPFGMNASKGTVHELNDVINCVMALINQLLSQGISPDKIVLMGDCLGAGVMQCVQHGCQQQSIQLRVINSNSFQSLKRHLESELKRAHCSYLQRFIKPMLKYLGWHMTPGKYFGYQDPYKTYLTRQGDHVLKGAKLHDKIGRIRANPKYADQCPQAYKSCRKWLEENCEVVYPNTNAKVEPHFVPLSQMRMKNNLNQNVYEGYINRYLEYSNQYIAKHPHPPINKVLQSLGPAHFPPFKNKQERNRMHRIFLKILRVLRHQLQLVMQPISATLSYFSHYKQSHSRQNSEISLDQWSIKATLRP